MVGLEMTGGWMMYVRTDGWIDDKVNEFGVTGEGVGLAGGVD